MYPAPKDDTNNSKPLFPVWFINEGAYCLRLKQ